MTTFLWLLVVAGGPLLIALALAYGMIRSRRLSGAEKRARAEAIERLYDSKDDRDRASPDMEPRGR